MGGFSRRNIVIPDFAEFYLWIQIFAGRDHVQIDGENPCQKTIFSAAVYLLFKTVNLCKTSGVRMIYLHHMLRFSFT